ncbi:hypothetical protein TNCV_2310061 [Trichonephila clavipes]|nr:hypothetical protein TNCV_2310061 [Trichonephila clavipes]
MLSMVAQRMTQITPLASTPYQLWQLVEPAWSPVPQEHIQSLFESMQRRVAVVISNNGRNNSCQQSKDFGLITEVVLVIFIPSIEDG